jgi:DNA polymerase-1
MEEKTFLIIDSNSVIHRAFHALPPLSTQKGEIVGAVYGFLLVFFKALKDFNPDFIAACFDVKGPTFRHQKYKEYKATRPPMPDDLSQQISKVKDMLKIFGVPVIEKQGFEADDLIGTLAVLAPKKTPELNIVILSGDTDTMQLVGEKTKVYNLRKGVKDTVLYDKEMVKEKYHGLEPRQLLDLRALKGDASDNIPGIPGIGEKTAIELLLEYDSLENIYENIALIKGKIREKLTEHKEKAVLSRELAEIKKDVLIDFHLEDCRWGSYDKEKAKHFLEELEFYSFIPKLAD